MIYHHHTKRKVLIKKTASVGTDKLQMRELWVKGKNQHVVAKSLPKGENISGSNLRCEVLW